MLIPANNTNTYKTGISVTLSAFLKMQFDTKIVLEENPSINVTNTFWQLQNTFWDVSCIPANI